jgi:1-acyl-sn-glycerol-3-phosphate acyltransferase
MAMKEVVRGLAMSFLMISGAFCLSILLFPSVLLIAIPSKRVILLRRYFIALFIGIYLDFTYFLIESVSGTRVHIYCEDPTILSDKSGVLILSNHRTRTDWLYVGLCYSSFLSVMSNLVIILKDSLRTAPIFGWLMQLGLYIFLKRSRENDLPHISKMLTYIASLGTVPSLLLFPEGTDLSESNLQKSNRFATENNLPQYQQVLHPKPSGLVTAVSAYREQQQQGGVIHDVTIAYEDYCIGKRSSEKSFLFGECISRLTPFPHDGQANFPPLSTFSFRESLWRSFLRREEISRRYFSLSHPLRLSFHLSVASPILRSERSAVAGLLLLYSLLLLEPPVA